SSRSSCPPVPPTATSPKETNSPATWVKGSKPKPAFSTAEPCISMRSPAASTEAALASAFFCITRRPLYILLTISAVFHKGGKRHGRPYPGRIAPSAIVVAQRTRRRRQIPHVRRLHQ